MTYDSSNDKQTILTEVGRISGRLKIATTFWAAGRDEAAFEMIVKEIIKLDELEMFLESVLTQEIDARANVDPESSAIN